VSFVFDIEPSAYSSEGNLGPTGTQRPRVTCRVHTSFHFWEMHRRILLRLASLLYTAVRPAFTILEVTRQGVKASGLTLPPKPDIPVHPSPPLPVLEYNHCRLAEVRPEVIWKGFPDPQVRRMEREYMNDFDKKLLYAQAKTRIAFHHSATAPTPVKEILSAPSLDTPTRPPKWQLRPLMLSPNPTESVIFSPTSTLVDTPRSLSASRHVSGNSEVTSMMNSVPGAMPRDTLTEGGPRSLFGPGGKYASRGRSASYMGI